MQQQFGQFQSLAKDSAEAVMQSFGAWTRGAQAVAAEVSGYSKRSFEQGSATFEKLVGARTMERALEIQGEFARSSYDGFMAQAAKVGEIVQGTAREAFAPVGSLMKSAVPSA